MRATGWVCDVCGKFSHTEEIPETWFVVTRVGVEAAEACSPTCLTRLGKSITALDGKLVCKDCGKDDFKTPGGLKHHRTTTHQKAKRPARKAPARLTRKTRKAPAGARRRK